MIQRIRLFLLGLGITVAIAAIVHAGYLIDGYEHDAARNAEGIIAAVLFAGLAVSLARPELTATTGVIVLGFALLGFVVGALTIAVGVGPRTVLDVIYHVIVLPVIAWGVVVAWRAQLTERSEA